MQEQLKLIQEENYSLFYKVGNFVDFCYYDQWEVGKISEEKEKTVTVYCFLDQSKKLEVFKQDSHKISRFRKHTKAAKQYNSSRFSIQSIINYFSLTISKARDILSSLKKGEKQFSYEILNTFHAHIFYIFELAFHPSNYFENKELEIVFDQANILLSELIIEILIFIKEHVSSLNEYIKLIFQNNDDLILFNPELTIVSFINEILVILFIIFGSNPYYNNIFIDYKKDFIGKFEKLYLKGTLNKYCNNDYYTKSKNNEYKVPKRIIAGFIDIFFKNKGFHLLKEIIEQSNQVHLVFYNNICSIFEIAAPYLDYFNSYFYKESIMLSKCICDKIGNLTEEQIQILNKQNSFWRTTESLLNIIDKSFKIQSKNKSINPLLTYIHLLFINFIKKPPEIQITVIEQTNSIIKQIQKCKESNIEKNNKQEKNKNNFTKKIKKFLWMEQEEPEKQEEKPSLFSSLDMIYFCKLLEKEGFINNLLDPSLNEGVFSTSLFIFQTMYSKVWKFLNDTELQIIRDKLWQKTIGEDSDGKIVINNSMKGFLSNFVMDLSYHHKEFIFANLKEFIINNGLNIDNLNFLTLFTLNCLDKDTPDEIISMGINNKENNLYNLYGMDLLWKHIIQEGKDKMNINSINNNEYNLFEEKNKTDGEEKKDDSLINTKKEFPSKSSTDIELMNECVDSFYKIISHKNIPNSLREKVIHQCYNYKHLKHSITQIYSLMILIFKNKMHLQTYNLALKLYNQDSTKTNEFLIFIKNELIEYFGLIPLDSLIDENILFQGMYSYSENIRKRLELLFLFFYNQSPSYINFDIFNEIWNICIKEPKAKEILFDCLSQSIPYLQFQILQEFNSKIIQKEFQVESVSSFILIKQLIIQLNIQNLSFYPLSDTDNSLFKVNPIYKIEGLEKLWELLIMPNTINEIKEDIISFITYICLNLISYRKSEFHYIKKHWSIIFQMLEKSFQEVINSKNKDENMINLLLTLIKKISTSLGSSIILKKEQAGTIISNLEKFSKGKNYLFLFKKVNTKTEKQLTFTKETRFTQVLNLLSYFFRFQRDKIECVIKKKNSKDITLNCNNEMDFFVQLLNINESSIKSDNEKISSSKETEIINVTEISIFVKERKHPILEVNEKPQEYLFSKQYFTSLLEELLKDRDKSYMKTVWFLLHQNNVSTSEEECNYIKKICCFYMDIDENEKSKIELKFSFTNKNILYISLVISQLEHTINIHKNNTSFLNDLFIKGYAWTKFIQPYFMNYSLSINEINEIEEKIEKIKIFNKLLKIHYYILSSVNLVDISESKAFFDKIIMFIKEINDLLNDLNKNTSITISIRREIESNIEESIQLIFKLLKLEKNILLMIDYLLNESLNIDIINLSYTLSSVQIQTMFNDYLIYIAKLYNNVEYNGKPKGQKVKQFAKEILKYYLNENTLNLIETLAQESKTVKTFNIFYSMLSNLISQMIIIDEEKEIRKDFENLINNFLFEKIISPHSENKLSELVLGGYLSIIYSILIITPDLKLKTFPLISTDDTNQTQSISFADILSYSLFTSKCNDNHKNKMPIISINLSYTKQYAYSLLVLLTFSNPLKRKEIIEQLNLYHKMQFWKKENDSLSWKILSNKDTEDKISRHVGIKNLGCTCYINSLIQTFYSIKTFKDALLSCECENNIKNSLFQLKKLFLNLEHTQKEYIETSEFCKNFDDQILNPKEQMDIDEFFITLLDKIENHLKQTSNADLVKYFFEGKNMDELIFKDACDFHRKNEFSNYSIQLQVKDKKNVFESLQTLIDGELMDEDNKIFCEQCNSKHAAVKRQSFLKLPRMLMFVLKRFEFNYLTGQKFKVNDYFEFPIDLDMTQYTTEYIHSDNKEEYLASCAQNNKYKLKAVVVHIGNSEGGHYFVYIRDDKTGEWNEFNDTKVTEFDINNLGKEAFGGFEIKNDFVTGKEEKIEIIKNAYLLFYEKIDQSNCQSFEKVSLEKKQFDITDILDNIYDDLKLYNIEKLLFSREYQYFIITYMLNMLMLFHNEENEFKTQLLAFTKNQNENNVGSDLKRTHLMGSNLSHQLAGKKIPLFSQYKHIINEQERNKELLDLFKFYIIYFFNVALRTRKEENFGYSLDILKYMLNYSEECSQYLIEEFYNRSVIDEYLFDCPEYNIKIIVVGIIYCAMISINNKYKPITKNNVIDINQPIDNKVENVSETEEISPCLSKFVENILYSIGMNYYELIENNISVLFHILFRFSQLGNKNKQFLLEPHEVQRFLKSLSYSIENVPTFIFKYSALNYNSSKHYILESCFILIDQINNNKNIKTNQFENYTEAISKQENKNRVSIYQHLLYFSLLQKDKFTKQLKSNLDESEMQRILFALFNGLKSRQGAYYLRELISILSKDNKYITNLFIEIFIFKFKSQPNEYYKYMLIVFKHFLYIDDSLKSKRINNSLIFLLEFLPKINNYSEIIMMYGDFLTDLFNENPTYFESMLSKQMKQFYSFIIPYYQNLMINKTILQRIIRFKRLFRRIETNTKNKLIEIDEEQEKDFQEESTAEIVSPDVDLTDYKFFFGDKITYRNMTWTVINFNDEMIYVETISKNHNKTLHEWIMTDNSELILKEPNPTPCQHIKWNT